MQRYYIGRTVARLFLLLAMLSPVTGHAALDAVVSVSPLQTFVERVGGANVTASVLVEPGQSPATYDPTPQQFAGLEGADVLFRIGVPFERSWIGRIKAAMPGLTVVDLSEGLALRRLDDHAHDDHPDESGTEPLDPHIWTSPPLAMEITRRIADALTRLDPGNAGVYRGNAESFIEALRQLDRDIRATLEGEAGRAFLVYHPAWGYFADTYGLRQVAIEAAGREPGPKQLARTIERARAAGVAVIFVQPQFSRANAEAVARAIGARVVTADPLSPDYLDNMRRVARAFAEALK